MAPEALNQYAEPLHACRPVVMACVEGSSQYHVPFRLSQPEARAPEPVA